MINDRPGREFALEGPAGMGGVGCQVQVASGCGCPGINTTTLKAISSLIDRMTG